MSNDFLSPDRDDPQLASCGWYCQAEYIEYICRRNVLNSSTLEARALRAGAASGNHQEEGTSVQAFGRLAVRVPQGSTRCHHRVPPCDALQSQPQVRMDARNQRMVEVLRIRALLQKEGFASGLEPCVSLRFRPHFSVSQSKDS